MPGMLAIPRKPPGIEDRHPAELDVLSGTAGPGEADPILGTSGISAGRRTPAGHRGLDRLGRRREPVAGTRALVPSLRGDAGRGAGGQPCALADDRIASVRRRVVRPAHGQAVVPGETRLFATG